MKQLQLVLKLGLYAKLKLSLLRSSWFSYLARSKNRDASNEPHTVVMAKSCWARLYELHICEELSLFLLCIVIKVNLRSKSGLSMAE